MWHQKHVEVIVSENRIIPEMHIPTAGSSESTYEYVNCRNIRQEYMVLGSMAGSRILVWKI